MDGTTLADIFIYEALNICPLKEKNYFYKSPKQLQKPKSKNDRLIEEKEEDSEKDQKENIGFIQLTTKDYKQTIIIEHFANNESRSIEYFDQEF